MPEEENKGCLCGGGDSCEGGGTTVGVRPSTGVGASIEEGEPLWESLWELGSLGEGSPCGY